MKTIGFILLGFFLHLASYAQTKTIVFVCEHGSAKSVIAATYFNKLAKEKNIPWQAVARGTDPDLEISPKTKILLASEGLLDSTFIPQRISQSDVDLSKRVILFYPLPETIQSGDKSVNWLEIQAVNEDFQRLKDDIVSKLTPLIDSLARR